MTSKEHSAAIAAALEALRDYDGLLHTDAVVEAARDPDSILHNHFTWDDSEAADKYRIEEARDLITSVKVSIRLGPTLIRAVCYVPTIAQISAYRRLDEVLPHSPDARGIILAELSRVGGVLGRAKKIAAVLQLDDEIDLLLEALLAVRDKVEKVEAR